MREDPLENAIWSALTTTHRHLAISAGAARRYPATVAPYAAVGDDSPAAMQDLWGLLEPGESVYLLGEPCLSACDLQKDGEVPCLQMVFPGEAAIPEGPHDVTVEALDCRHAIEMLDLISVAYPGYFRTQTCSMGRYYGVRDAAGRLIAMGGERLVSDPFREISGLCALPAYAGKGLGTAVLRRVLLDQRASGCVSWLYVTETNHRAAQLYGRLGFELLRRAVLHRVTRPATG